MNNDQLRSLIQRTLKYVDDEIPYSENAVELLMLTAAQESHLGHYIRQVKGPAMGIFQMEPNTERDIWQNYLKYNTALEDLVVDVGDCYVSDDLPVMESNLVYAILMARIHYLRVPKKLPTSLEGYAEYWKTYYNTPLGKGTVEEALENYKRLAI